MKRIAKKTTTRLAQLDLREVWIHPDVLTWDAEVNSSSMNDRSEWVRAHELWLHAQNRLKNSATREDLADVIGILRRVLNHRLKKLKMLYLENLPVAKKPGGTIEQLALVGVVKPLMLHKLLEIRNEIEYQDSKPPNPQQCAELLEFMWYFLRSTDVLIRFVADDLSFTKVDKAGNETPYVFTLRTGPENKWNNEILGWFEPKMVSLKEKSDWLKVEIESIHTKQERWGNRKRIHSDKKSDDIWIIGKLVSASYVERICTLYFAHSFS